MSERNLYNTYCEDESKYCSIKKNPNQAKIIELCNNNYRFNVNLSNSLLILYESEIGIIGDINLFVVLNNTYSKSIDDIITKRYIVDVHTELGDIEFFFDYSFYSDKNMEIQSDTWFKRLSLIDTDELKAKIEEIKANISEHLSSEMLDNVTLFLQKYFELILEYNLNTSQLIKIFKDLEFRNNAISLNNRLKLIKLKKKLEKKIIQEEDVEENKAKLENVKKGLALFNWYKEYTGFEKQISEDYANKIISSTSSIIDNILEPFSGNSDFVFNVCSGSRIDMLIPVFVLKHITQKLEIEEADSINRFSIISFCKQEYNQYKSVLESGAGGISFNSILFEYLNNDDNILSIIRTYNPSQNINDENRQKLLSIIRSRLNIYYISSENDILGIYNFFFPILYKKLFQKQLIIENQPIFIHVGFAQHGNYNDSAIGKMLYLINKGYNFVFYATNFMVYPNKSFYKRTLKATDSEKCTIDGKGCYPNLKIGDKDYNEGIYTILTKDAVVEFYE